MYYRIVGVSLLSAAACILLQGGQFKYGINQGETATFKVSRPPDFPLSGTSLTLMKRPGVPFPDEQSLDIAVAQGLSSELTVVPKDGDNVLVLTIGQYIPVSTKTYTTTESLFGNKASGLAGILNKSASGSNSGIQEVHWQSSGDLQLNVLLLDKSGAQLESFVAKGTAQRDVVLSRAGQQVTDPQSLPNPQVLMAQLVASAAGDVRKHYLRTTEPVSAMLTVDPEVRQANESFAINGRWKEALAAYQSASVKKHPADRLYNMAVCQEALAYAAYDETHNPSDAAPLFTEALKLYDQALELDPKEKYFQLAKARIDDTRGNFARAIQQEQEQLHKKELARQKLQDKATEVQQRQEADARPDTANEAAFRRAIDLRLRKASSPSPATVSDLKDQGNRLYHLEPADADRVLSQESVKLQQHQQDLEGYKRAFSDVVKDKVIDSDDRQMLTDLATRANLTTAEVKAVESQFQFQEAGTQTASSGTASGKTVSHAKTSKASAARTSTNSPAKADDSSAQPAAIKPQP